MIICQSQLHLGRVLYYELWLNICNSMQDVFIIIVCEQRAIAFYQVFTREKDRRLTTQRKYCAGIEGLCIITLFNRSRNYELEDHIQ